MKVAIIILLIILIVGGGGFFWYTKYYLPANPGLSDNSQTNEAPDECVQNVALNSADDVKAWAVADKQCRGANSVLGACRGDLDIDQQGDSWLVICRTFDGSIIMAVDSHGKVLGRPDFIQTN